MRPSVDMNPTVRYLLTKCLLFVLTVEQKKKAGEGGDMVLSVGAELSVTLASLLSFECCQEDGQDDC